MDVLTLVLFFIVASLAWYWRWERSIFVRQVEEIPGPPRVFLFGNIFALPRDGPGLLQIFNVTWTKAYGHIYRFWRGMFAIVNISSPSDVEVILTSQVHINKSITGAFLLPWLGDGLLLSAGDKWRKDRKLLTPAFHFQILDGFFDVFNRNSEIFVEQIKKRLLVEIEIDVYPMISRCTLDIICEAAMGIQIDAQLNYDSEYITAIDRIETMIQGRINSLLGLLPDWFYFQFTPHGRKLQKFLDLVHGFTRKVMMARKAIVDEQLADEAATENESGKRKRRAFLDLLLEAARKGAAMSETDIISQVDTFMFEGHDTTSAAVTWFLYCMATHPHEQDRVYQELQDCFGDSDRPCTLEDLSKLKHLDCCIKESLRLHPPVPFIRRGIYQDVRLSGHKIPANTSLGIQIYALHHNEEFFPEPEAYKPERFLPDQAIGRNPFAYVPFSAGPRNCIGQKFALYEDKVIVTTLLRQFRFDVNPHRLPIRESLNMILKPDGGMPLLITPRC
ncbi:cytochrome P450 4C1-like [Daphnia carinata]|uniref:cytochrome P450 4C1-like n=1 Tax=Daphnia carinata TaxID=120202 RepID=UPI00257AE244|nr:cytochrome P450 4C1-like [Daphnia carinata]